MEDFCCVVVGNKIDVVREADANTVTEEVALRFTYPLAAVVLGKCFSGPENCPFPVVAALHGSAIGLSLDISAACDIRLTAAETTFSHLDVNLAMCADAGVHSRMAKVCGNQSLVNQYALTGHLFTPEVAKEMGFVSTIVPRGRVEVVAATVEIAR